VEHDADNLIMAGSRERLTSGDRGLFQSVGLEIGKI